MSDEEMRTYEVVTSGQRLRMTIPAAWKVTYGPVSPGSKAGYNGAPALRIYENETKQRAIFLNVVSFRDLSVKVEVAAARKYGTQEWFLDDGSFVGDRVDKVEKRWMDIDEVKPGTPLDEAGGDYPTPKPDYASMFKAGKGSF